MFIIGANEGTLEIRGENGVIANGIATAKTLVYNLEKADIDLDFDDVFFSSSMDFADEYGFDTYDGAKELWEEGAKRWYATREGQKKFYT